MTFKVGDKVRRVTGRSLNDAHGVGFVGQILSIKGDFSPILEFTDGSAGFADQYELVSEGPVRTETVTKRRIVPGVYGRLRVFEGVEGIAYELTGDCYLTATELDDLAMVASQLAEALRDGLD